MGRGSSRALAVDLGSTSTLVWERGRGIVLDEPTVLAVAGPRKRVVAMGRAAFDAVLAGDGQVVVERPLRAGKITEFLPTQQLLALVLEALGATRFSRPRILMCVPTAITDVERRAVEEAVRRAGASSCHVLEEPLAAGIGAGLPVADAVGSMVLDIGGGASEVAVLSLGGVVVSRGVGVGGYDLDEAISAAVRDRHDVAIGDRTAEELKRAVGTAFPDAEDRRAEVIGRERATGRQRAVVVDSELVRRAIEPAVTKLVRGVLAALSECPPELTQDVLLGGMHLVGGGAELRGLAARLEHETEVAVHVADEPRLAVIRGAGQTVEELDDLRVLG